MKTKLPCQAALLLALAVGCARESPPPSPAAGSADALETEEQKTVYALGLLMSRNLENLNLTPAEVALVQRGLGDAAAGRPAVKLEEYGPKIQELAQGRAVQAVLSQKEGARAFIEDAAKEAGAVRTSSGLVSKTLKAGSGSSPKASDVVKVHYEGRLVDGKVFDSSVQRGQPVEFPLDRVIPCWSEGVQRMKVGEKVRLVCPSDIAYGDQGKPPTIPGGATLVFEVELLEVKKK